jgi:hypothetical protein
LFQLEGVRRRHVYVDGEYWDDYIYAIWRDEFIRDAKGYIATLSAGGRS